MSDIQLRIALIQDLPTLLQFEQGVIAAERPYNKDLKPDPVTYYDLLFMLQDPNTCVVVAELNNQLVGAGYVQIRQSKVHHVHEQHGYLGFMYVDPVHRGEGINQQVMQYLIEWAKTQQVNAFYLDVYQQNDAAIRAYEKMGFEPCLLEMKLKS